MPSSEVFHKFGAGKLHSGSKSGPVVKNPKQAVAIMFSEKRAEGAHGGKYPEHSVGNPEYHNLHYHGHGFQRHKP